MPNMDDTKAPPKPEQQTSITITPAQVVPSTAAKFMDAVAYETMTAGQPVCVVSPSLAIASAGNMPTVRLAGAGTGQYAVIGIAANGASLGQLVKVILSDPLLQLATAAPPAIGDVVYLGTTAGSLTVTYADIVAGMYVAVIGVGAQIGKINLNIVAANAPK